jgi:hypothetical protein
VGIKMVKEISSKEMQAVRVGIYMFGEAEVLAH